MAIVMDAAALQAFMHGSFSEMADAFAIERVDDAELVLRLLVGPQHLRPGGTVSGPAIFALADVAMYLALLARIGPVALAVTTSCSLDFMRKPAAGHDLCGHARILKLGRSLAVGDVMIYSDGVAEPVARASLTYSIPPVKSQAMGV